MNGPDDSISDHLNTEQVKFCYWDKFAIQMCACLHDQNTDFFCYSDFFCTLSLFPDNSRRAKTFRRFSSSRIWKVKKNLLLNKKYKKLIVCCYQLNIQFILRVYFIWQVSNPTGQSQLPHKLFTHVHKGKTAGLLNARFLCVMPWVRVRSQQLISFKWGSEYRANLVFKW